MDTKKVTILQEDLEEGKTRAVLKDGVVKVCPCCQKSICDDDLRSLVNGLAIYCGNCRSILEAEIVAWRRVETYSLIKGNFRFIGWGKRPEAHRITKETKNFVYFDDNQYKFRKEEV